jgi:hypothetical protein
MSHPLTDCLIARACASEEGYVVLREAMRVNMLYGHWSTYHGPCPHDPKCYTSLPTQEQIDALNARLQEDLKDAPRGGCSPGHQGCQGISPKG